MKVYERQEPGGFGLLIVERDTVFEVIKPVDQNPFAERVSRVISGLPDFHKIDLDWVPSPANLVPARLLF